MKWQLILILVMVIGVVKAYSFNTTNGLQIEGHTASVLIDDTTATHVFYAGSAGQPLINYSVQNNSYFWGLGFSYLFINVTPPVTTNVTPTPTPPTGGGRRPIPAGAIFYDLIVESLMDTYMPGDYLNATITIRNFGAYPDHDATLTYYWVDANNQTFGLNQQSFVTVPIGETIIPVAVLLPEGAVLGEYQIIAEYDTPEIQKLPPSIDSFRVVKRQITLIFIIIMTIIIAAIIYYGRAYKKVEDTITR